MIIRTSSTVEYEIPDDWIAFTEINTAWTRSGDLYPWRGSAELILLSEIEPIQRSLPPSNLAVRKYKLVPVLFAFMNPQGLLDAITVESNDDSPYKYRLTDGFHRYVASLLVGYSKIAAVIKGDPLATAGLHE